MTKSGISLFWVSIGGKVKTLSPLTLENGPVLVAIPDDSLENYSYR
jgi:hypothetical protein